MTTTSGFLDMLKDQFAALGQISVRRMFGGAGVYCDGLMFGLVADDVLYLKVDEQNRAVFDAEELDAFAYETSKGVAMIASYRRAPECLWDDPDEAMIWGRNALAAARRAAASGKSKRARSK